MSSASNKVIQRIETGNAPAALAVGFGSTWVASAVDQNIWHGSSSAIGGQAAESTWGRANRDRRRRGSRVGHERGERNAVPARAASRVRDSIDPGREPSGGDRRRTGVWVVNQQDATVWRIDPATEDVTDTIADRAGSGPAIVAGRF